MNTAPKEKNAKPITVIGGYLGSGKTTLINRLLGDPAIPEGTAVLVNDFGDINIDETLIRDQSADGTVIGLSNGCICCSISDDLSKALDTLNKMPIRQVILETSGVAEPSRVLQHCHYPGFRPRAAIVVVDASNFSARSKDKYVGSLVRAQVDQAHLLIVSKTDLNPSFELKRLTPQVGCRDAGLIETILGWQASAENFSSTKTHSTMPTFSAYTWHQQEPITKEKLSTLLAGLDASVERVKGWVATDEGTYHINRVAAHIELNRTDLDWQPDLLGLVLIHHTDINPSLEEFFATTQYPIAKEPLHS